MPVAVLRNTRSEPYSFFFWPFFSAGVADGDGDGAGDGLVSCGLGEGARSARGGVGAVRLSVRRPGVSSFLARFFIVWL